MAAINLDPWIVPEQVDAPAPAPGGFDVAFFPARRLRKCHQAETPSQCRSVRPEWTARMYRLTYPRTSQP